MGCIDLKDLDVGDLHQSRLPLHLDPCTGILIELFPVDLACGIHGCKLLIAPGKGKDRLADLRFRRPCISRQLLYFFYQVRVFRIRIRPVCLIFSIFMLFIQDASNRLSSHILRIRFKT